MVLGTPFHELYLVVFVSSLKEPKNRSHGLIKTIIINSYTGISTVDI